MPYVLKRHEGDFIYSGSYINGHAYYEYNNSGDGDDPRVYNGRFEYHGRYKSSHEGQRVHDEISGYYKNDLKNGRWTFIRKGKGIYKELKVDYTDGTPNGMYTYYAKGLSVNKFQIHMTIEMHNGHPTGKIKGRLKDSSFNGQCDTDGCPDGLWLFKIFSDKNITYYELWDHGILNDSYSISISTGKKHAVPEKIRSIIKEIVCYDSMPLEKIIRKGAHVWDGDITVIRNGE